MNRNNQSRPSFPKRVYRYYSENGGKELIKGSVSYGKNYMIRHQSDSAIDIQSRSNNHRIWYDTEEKPIQISPPDHELLRDTFEKYPMEFRPDPGYVCELQNCHLVGENAVGLYRGRKLILETSGCRIHNTFTGSQSGLARHALKSWLGHQPTKSKPTIFPLICPDPSYYHWMVEYMPKLRLVELYEKETESKPTILIEPNARDFVRDTLACAGYDSDRCEEWDEQSMIVNNLVVSAHRPRVFNYQRPQLSNYNPSFKDLNWLRSRMRSIQCNSSVEPTKRIYISRQDATRERKIVNYQEFISVLERHDIQPYILENYSFSEQLAIFKDAELIMGPHGAGLLNMIFSADPIVIELFPKTIIKPHFYFLSSMFGFEYEAMVADNEGNNLIVDTGKLDDLICDLMSEVQM